MVVPRSSLPTTQKGLSALRSKDCTKTETDVSDVQDDGFRFLWNTPKHILFCEKQNAAEEASGSVAWELSLKASLLAVSSPPLITISGWAPSSSRGVALGKTRRVMLIAVRFSCTSICKCTFYIVSWSLHIFDRHVCSKWHLALLPELIQFLSLSLLFLACRWLLSSRWVIHFLYFPPLTHNLFHAVTLLPRRQFSGGWGGTLLLKSCCDHYHSSALAVLDFAGWSHAWQEVDVLCWLKVHVTNGQKKRDLILGFYVQATSSVSHSRNRCIFCFCFFFAID